MSNRKALGRPAAGKSPYHDAMIDHDKNVGTVLDKIDRLGIADNTIVMYSTDNGPHMNSWPDAAMTPFRSEKNSNWEGAYRVPAMVRWPGKIKPGIGVQRHHLASRLGADPAGRGGCADIKEKAAQGLQGGTARPTRFIWTATISCPT